MCLFALLFNLVYYVMDLATFIKHHGFQGFGAFFSQTIEVAKSTFPRLLYLYHSRYLFVEIGIFSIVFLVVLVKSGKRAYTNWIAYSDINKGTKGTSRWMQKAEIERLYDTFDFEMTLTEPQLERGGFPVTIFEDRVTMAVDCDNTNLKIIGTSQTGKTQTMFYWSHYLNSVSQFPDSELVNDLKGDMLVKTLGSPAAEKFDIYALNFLNPRNSIRFNPFGVVLRYAQKGQMEEAEIALNGLAMNLFANEGGKDQEFYDAASGLFTAIALVLLKFAIEYNNPKWFTLTGFYDLVAKYSERVGENETVLLDEYIKAQPPSSSIRKNYLTAQVATKKQIQSFYMILASSIKKFANESILQLTSHSDLDFEAMGFPEKGQKPILVFISFPLKDNIYEPIQAMFYSQMISVLTKKAQLTRGQKLKRRVRLLLDEVQNSPRIAGLNSVVNVGQQIGILVALGLQSLGGFAEKYPDKEGAAILNGTPATFYLMSEEPEDAESFSKRLGDSTVVKVSRSGDPLDSDKSFTETEDDRRLLKPEELMRLAMDEAIFTNVKKRVDKDGKDVVPNPIFSRKYRKIKKQDRPNEPKIKKWLGIAQKEEITEFSSYTELLPAHKALFKGKDHEYFDDRGLGIEDIDLRKGEIEKDAYGQEIPFNHDDYRIPHEIVEAEFMLATGLKADGKSASKPDLKNAIKLIADKKAAFAQKGTPVPEAKVVSKQKKEETMPQELNESLSKTAFETNNTQGVSEKATQDISQVTVEAVLGERYDEVMQLLSPKQRDYFKNYPTPYTVFSDNILNSSQISEENKSKIKAIIQEVANGSRK
ncbi:hypothetical protein RyT2_14150 [Pseudolactococcus yaeyamensis]